MLRTPLLPASTLLAWQAAPTEFLAELLARPEIDEAIFVASPSLHTAKDTWRTKPGVRHALAKYVARMSARSTPFGLFSGVSTGVLGRETRIALDPRPGRRTRLDNDYLFVLATELARQHADRLIVRVNDSIYRIAGKLRCAVARVNGEERRYELISVELTPYLDATLARAAHGATPASLAEALVGEDVTLDDARAYIGELIGSQLLVPELGVQITGPEPLDALIAALSAAGIETRVLEDARAAIGELDRGVNPPARYREIATALEALPAKVELARLFQVDLARGGDVQIDHKLAHEALAVSLKLAGMLPAHDGPFVDFKRAFGERWDQREVPLAEVLDEESGIGFEVTRHPGAEGAPLLAGLGFPGGTAAKATWRYDHLLARLGDRELVLTDADFTAWKVPKPAKLPDAFAIMLRVGPDRALYSGTSGPSGARLNGRFCHVSPALDGVVRAHLAREEALAPDAIFAEIAHLNEGRIGNILCRPVLRAHEIAYLGISGAPRDRQLSIEDLLVSVRGDRVVLRSRRLGREVIPRLTTAHNYRLRSLGVYRFLCALAEQGADGAAWSWGPLGSAPHLPRVTHGRLVLARETWNLTEAECKLPLAELRARRELPRFVVLADSDNELPIDLENPLLVDALADELSGRKRAQLVELFPGPEALANEVVISYVKEAAPRPALAPAPAMSAQRTFPPGGEWLYAKIYCGEASADRVLREAIAPVVRAHGGPWFFIRYNDPEPHLRVRLHGVDWGAAMPALERALAPLIASGVARKLQLDTYERELERYGGDAGIGLAEELFWRDSECVLSIVELLSGDAGADARWRLAIRGIESMLVALGVVDREKLYASAKESLGKEFNADVGLWTRIGDRFAKERASLDQLFAPSEADAEHDLEPGFTLLAERDVRLAGLGDRMRAAGVDVEGLAWSLVHMHANRLLHASHRAQELVLYDFLRRLHASKRSRRG